ncbi:MAG: MFS transporter [Desulfuromonadales bacterium]|nr:MFS transporter [Desulfuromonadales bacterium]
MEGPDLMTVSPQQKRRAWFGWCMYDWANSGFATVVLAAVFPVYFAALVPTDGAYIPFLGRTMPAAALWGYIIAASMFLVAILAPYLGALADHRGDRRRFLILFTLLGAAATSLLAFAGPGRYWLAGALFIVANVGFASGNVFYNAFLPALARGSEMDRLSARGFATGYVGGGLLLAFCFVLIQWPATFGLADAGSATRLGLLITGLWWVGFAIPTFLYVREEVLPHPPEGLPTGLRGYLRTLAEIRHYRDLAVFLIAFLFYNDGIQTIIVVSAIFARQELGLSQTSILGCFLMIQFVAWPGAILFGRLAERAGAKTAVMVSLAIFTGVTVYAFFLQREWEFWLLAFVVALVLGGSQSISRSLYGALIPPGKNARYFGFYAVSSKFASILGPFIFALITDLTRSARFSILALAGFFLVGMALLATVKVERGQAQALREIP